MTQLSSYLPCQWFRRTWMYVQKIKLHSLCFVHLQLYVLKTKWHSLCFVLECFLHHLQFYVLNTKLHVLCLVFQYLLCHLQFYVLNIKLHMLCFVHQYLFAFCYFMFWKQNCIVCALCINISLPFAILCFENRIA